MNTLRKNDQGNEVLFLQMKLQLLQFEINTSAKFDSKTETAVKRFQSQNHLKADGIFGKNSWIALYLKTAYTRPAIEKTDRFNNILHLHPTMRWAAVKTVFQLQAEGLPFRIHCAYRYPEAQELLYAQGRTTPGSIITHAKPWQSYHQYGLACDFGLLVDGVWIWKNTGAEKAWWDRLHLLGNENGLEVLSFEKPHLQLKNIAITDLKNQIYPPNGDASWKQNLLKSIEGWSAS